MTEPRPLKMKDLQVIAEAVQDRLDRWENEELTTSICVVLVEDFHVPATINHLRDLTRHEWALVITAVVTLAAIAALILIALGKGWL